MVTLVWFLIVFNFLFYLLLQVPAVVICLRIFTLKLFPQFSRLTYSSLFILQQSIYPGVTLSQILSSAQIPAKYEFLEFNNVMRVSSWCLDCSSIAFASLVLFCLFGFFCFVFFYSAVLCCAAHCCVLLCYMFVVLCCAVLCCVVWCRAVACAQLFTPLIGF